MSEAGAGAVEAGGGGGEVGHGARVGTLELFFDLVFVFTVTQLASLLLAAPDWHGVARTAVVLGIVWWMYDGYAWLTNSLGGTTGGVVRGLLLAGMASFLVVALAIPTAFDGDGLVFGVGYLLVNLVHAGLFLKATGANAAQAFRAIAPFNGVSAVAVLVGGTIGGAAQPWIWFAAVAFQWITPRLTGGLGDFRLDGAHFVERHALVVLVAIGESVVVAGTTAAHDGLGAASISASVLGLALSACLWFAYFGEGADERAAEAMVAAPAGAGGRLAIGIGYSHYVLLGGIIAIAAAEHAALADPTHVLEGGFAWLLAGGAAAWLVGMAWAIRLLGLGTGGPRLAAAVLAFAVVPLGTQWTATAEVAGLVALLAALFAWEHHRPPRTAAPRD